MKRRSIKKIILPNLPYLFIALFATKLPQAWRLAAGADATEKLLPLLDENETDMYKRGRNAKSAHAPRSAGAVEYRRATGLECLFGYLYLCGRIDRARALFDAACVPAP